MEPLGSDDLMFCQYCVYFYGRRIPQPKLIAVTRRLKTLGVFAKTDDGAILVYGLRDDIELALNNSLATIDRKLQADIVRI